MAAQANRSDLDRFLDAGSGLPEAEHREPGSRSIGPDGGVRGIGLHTRVTASRCRRAADDRLKAR